MADIAKLPVNLIGKKDQVKLESYGGHEIAHGRATRFHWDQDEHGNPNFGIYRGGAEEELFVKIGRDRKRDEFWAKDGDGALIVSGALDHVMAVIEKKLAAEHNRGGSAE